MPVSFWRRGGSQWEMRGKHFSGSAATCIALVACALAGCGAKEGRDVGPVNGIVVSAGSGRPLAGAQVLIEWRARTKNFVTYSQMVIRMCKTVSAADGTFSAPAWRASSNVTDAVFARAFVFLDGFSTRLEATALEHPGAESVAHPMFELRDGETAASGDLMLAQLADCA